MFTVVVVAAVVAVIAVCAVAIWIDRRDMKAD
jgi:Tfp pilus assembly protein FimT